MWSITSKGGCSDHKLPLLWSFPPSITDKQFPIFINRANPSVHMYENYSTKAPMKPPVNSSPQPVTKNNPINNNQGCNSNKKKKKKRRRRKKKCQSANRGGPMENSSQPCRRQRHISLESEDGIEICFVEGHITELSENETETTEDFDSSDSIIPCKKVRFADELCEVHPMVMWSYAYQAARKGPWEEYARDRDRFDKRIRNTEAVIGHVFNKEHRSRIYKQRFS